MLYCGGEALIDLYPADASARTWAARPGGSPLNVAVAAARLGVETGFLGHLSSDRLGTLIRDHLVSSDVALTAAPTGPAATTLAVVDPGAADREPSFSFHSAGTTAALPPPELPADATVLHVSGSVSLVLPECATAWADLLDAVTSRVLVTLDPNARPAIAGGPSAFGARLDRWLDAADIVKVSRGDLEWLEPGVEALSVAARWLERGPVAVIVTMAEAGAAVVTRSTKVEVPARAIEVVDPVGAGDTFMAGVATSLIEAGATSAGAVADLDDAVWRAALDLGARAAALNISRLGADPPTRGEL